MSHYFNNGIRTPALDAAYRNPPGSGKARQSTSKWCTPEQIHITPTHHRIPKGAMVIAALLILLWMMVGCAVFNMVTIVMV